MQIDTSPLNVILEHILFGTSVSIPNPSSEQRGIIALFCWLVPAAPLVKLPIRNAFADVSDFPEPIARLLMNSSNPSGLLHW
jgi:hypothetical protein